ncbi:MAG: hypothetical protein MI753_01810 [Hyphomicrobiales bacterium]|nr:hypothetical protein [Hyphomicrobiales bacterium]
MNDPQNRLKELALVSMNGIRPRFNFPRVRTQAINRLSGHVGDNSPEMPLIAAEHPPFNRLDGTVRRRKIDNPGPRRIHDQGPAPRWRMFRHI